MTALFDRLAQAGDAFTAEQVTAATTPLIRDRDTALTEIAALRTALDRSDKNDQAKAARIMILEARIRELETPPVAPTPVVVRPTGAGFVAAESLPAKTRLTETFAQAPKGSQITLGETVTEFSDFQLYDDRKPGAFGLGLYLTAGRMGLRGSGTDKSIVRMKPRSSTRADRVPPNPPAGTVNYLNVGTNNLHTLRLGNNDGPITLTHLTLEGTEQGHEYNGIVLSSAPDSHINSVKVTGIPGSAGANPGETFSINVYQSPRTVLGFVEIDGRLNGAPVAAAGIGVNNSNDVLIEDSYIHDTRYGSGMAWFQCDNPTLRRVKIRNIGGDVGINFERIGGTLLMEKVDFGTGGKRWHAQLQSDTKSAVVKIVDPIFEGPKLLFRAGGTYQGNPSKQNVADIRLFMGGVERPDLLTILK